MTELLWRNLKIGDTIVFTLQPRVIYKINSVFYNEESPLPGYNLTKITPEANTGINVNKAVTPHYWTLYKHHLICV